MQEKFFGKDGHYLSRNKAGGRHILPEYAAAQEWLREIYISINEIKKHQLN